MNSIIEFISKNDSIIMTGLFILIIILTAIVTIMDFVNKRNTKDLLGNDEENDFDILNQNQTTDNVVLNINEVVSENIDVPIVVEEKTDSSSELKEIKYVEEDEELEKTKAKLELQNLKEELIKAEAEKEVKEENIPVYIGAEEETIDVVQTKLDAFEQAQEENAIISLEQFNKISDKVYDENEITQFQYKDEGNEPISIQELEQLYNTKELKVISEDFEQTSVVEPIKVEEVLDVKEDKVAMTDTFVENTNKFKNSPIISPVFGIDVQEKINAIELENTANLGKLDEEIRKTNEFLNTLRELRKNLEP